MPRKRLSYAEMLVSGRNWTQRELTERRLEEEMALVQGKTPIKPPRAARPAPAVVPSIVAPCPASVAVGPDCAAGAVQYANDVLSGAVIAGHLVKLAAKRFLADIADGATRGFTFSPAAAQAPVDYVAGLGLELLPFQLFLLAGIFGFVKADGSRRTKIAHVELSKKNGKSTLSGGLALHLASPRSINGDGATNPKVIMAATTKSQAADICFRQALQMRLKNPALEAITKVSRDTISFPASNALVQPIPANSDKLNGLIDVHGLIVDELADHKSPDLYNRLHSTQIGLRNALTITISTAGAERIGNICWENREHALQVLEGAIVDDGFFAFIATLDEGDSWMDPKCWIKSNPGLGVLIPEENLAAECLRAKTISSARSSFERYHANIWSAVSEHRWIYPETLAKTEVLFINGSEKACTVSERIAQAAARLQGKKCILGFDRGISNDLSALAAIFPQENNRDAYEVLFKFWVPEDSIVERTMQHRVPYKQWRDNGWLIATPGAMTDQRRIAEDILDFVEQFSVQECGLDPAHADVLYEVLKNSGMTCSAVRQGFNLSGAIVKVEELLVGGKLCLHGNEIALWNIGNAQIDSGKYQVRLDKERSREKIDGAVALCNAFSVQMTRPMPRIITLDDLRSGRAGIMVI